MVMIWWLWFSPNGAQRRAHLVAVLSASLLGLVLARVLAPTLPFRDRPLHHLELAQVRFPIPSRMLDGWSSFPSDHAVYFFALATGILLISRKLGIFALAFAVLYVCLPRLYLGLHWATDLLAGAALGTAMALLLSRAAIRDRLSRPALRWLEKHPASFYAAFFLFTYQMAEMFDGLRTFASALSRLLGF